MEEKVPPPWKETIGMGNRWPGQTLPIRGDGQRTTLLPVDIQQLGWEGGAGHVCACSRIVTEARVSQDTAGLSGTVPAAAVGRYRLGFATQLAVLWAGGTQHRTKKILLGSFAGTGKSRAWPDAHKHTRWMERPSWMQKAGSN